MPKRRTKPNGSSIFSIDPATGLPYIPVEEATTIILWQIQRQHSSMLKRFETDDLTQDVLTRLALVTYSKEKSAPTTFITMVTDSVLWNKHRYSRKNDRFLEIPDFALANTDESIMVTELGTDSLNPESYLLAVEIVDQALNPSCKRKRKCKLRCKCKIKLPPGYQQQRSLRSNSQK
jgi:DNA-directed RNA polymerase specialized sigma24 family protein